MIILNLIIGVLLGLFVIWLSIVLIRLVIWLLVRKVKHSIKGSSRGFENSLVELAFKFGKQVNCKPLIELIEQARKLISKDPNLLSLSSVWTDIIECIRESRSKEMQLSFFQYIFTKAKFPNAEKLAAYLVELVNINFLNPPQKPDKKILGALTEDCVREFELYAYDVDGIERHYKIEGIEFIEDDWEKAMSEEHNLVLSADSLLPNEIREALQKSVSEKYFNAIRDIIFGVSRSIHVSGEHSNNDYLDSIEKFTKQIAELIMIDDQIKQRDWPKILSLYMEMYNLGVWPLGVVEKNDKNNYPKKFIVFIPPAGKGAKYSFKAMPFYERLWHVNKDFAQALGKK